MSAVQKPRIAEIAKIDPPESIFCRSRVKRWAYHNAYTLIFLTVMFAISWIVTIIVGST